MVIREYLVENFGFDDSQLNTMGMGKQANAGQGGEEGTIQILIFPTGTENPSAKQTPSAAASKATTSSSAAAQKTEDAKP